MSKIRLVIAIQISVVGLAGLLVRPAAAQPESAAWSGLFPQNPTAYELAGNWIDLATGGAAALPPDATSHIFFDGRAGQAPRDGAGNVVVSLRGTDLGAESMRVQSLPFRFNGGGTLTIGQLAKPGAGTLVVQESGMLTLDQATLQVRDSVIIGGGPIGPTGGATGIAVRTEGSLLVGETIQLSNTPGSLFQLLGGTVRATRIDTGFGPQQFQWMGGQLSVDEFSGNLSNPSGTLAPGLGAVLTTIDGSYSQQTNARLNMQIGGTTLGQTYDHLNVSGAFNAGGTLAVSFLDNFTPAAGSEFDLLNFASLSGVFENVILPGLPSGLEWDVANLHSQGILRVIRPGIPISPALWTGGAADNNYFNPANWSNGIVPVNAENASFGVSVPAGATVSVSGAQTVEVTGFLLSPGGVFNVGGGADFMILGDGEISGSISVVGPGSSFTTGDAPVTLIGAPRLVVSAGGLLQAAAERYAVTVDPGTRVLMSASDPGSLLDLSTMDELAIGVATNNSFFVSATNGADIDLSGLDTISGVPNGLGRLVLRADSGGGLHFGNVDVSGRANLEAAGANASVDVEGTLQLHAASRLSLTGGATMQVGGNFLFDIVSAADFNADAAQIHFVGDGTQMLEVGGQDMGDFSEGGPASGNFGAGKLLVGQPGMPTTLMLTDAANNGGNNQPEALYLFGLGAGAGLEVNAGSKFMMNGLNVYSDGITSAGEVVLDGNLSATDMFMNDGVISGNGMVSGMVINNGILSPGNSSGEIEIDGDVESSGGSSMQIEIGGPMPAMQHDRVRITKTMMLDGSLEVTLIDGGMGIFEPNKGDEFEILTANGGIQGTFTSVSLPPLPAALGWQLQYAPTAISLAVLPRLGGDFDADGDVDRSDLAIFDEGVGMLTGASQTDGDSDGDGDVDGDDLLSLLLNFGASPAAGLSSSPVAVPEPSGVVLAGLLFVIAAIGARRQSRRLVR